MPADVFEWLEASQLAVFIRQSPLLFPAIEVVHIVGFIFLVGSAFMFDLRLLGVAGRLAVKDAAGYVLPWSRRSLLLVIPSGLLLFISQATALSTNSIFGIKLILILAAFTNAAIFHRYTLARCERSVPTPPAAKAAAILSLLLWTAVITCGRLIAYF
ncbi:DUF6644 family protein [Dawidia soli]|uniref:DUF6644 domain-containing protein n=1 Tax=Dawidia soli TaxID=2782352 RepID=A0AAP2DF48_9BACT|nr:DUF6644 family protein [Dawidia soli]MBT1689640.1 hypothetical protein [Dawidia soli]